MHEMYKVNINVVSMRVILFACWEHMPVTTSDYFLDFSSCPFARCSSSLPRAVPNNYGCFLFLFFRLFPFVYFVFDFSFVYCVYFVSFVCFC